MWLDISPDLHEFEGVDGNIHSFPGMSVAGVLEFEAHLGAIDRIKQEFPELDAQEHYKSNKYFRYLCDRCLELNGINPAWVGWSQVERLLFGYWDEAAISAQPPLLISIQRPPSESGRSASEAATLEQIIGSLAAFTDIKTACEMVQNLTPAQLSGILHAKEASLETPEQKLDRTSKEAIANRRQQMMDKYDAQ